MTHQHRAGVVCVCGLDIDDELIRLQEQIVDLDAHRRANLEDYAELADQRDELVAEIAHLRAELSQCQQERDDAYLIHSNTKQLLEAVVKERDKAVVALRALEEAR